MRGNLWYREVEDEYICSCESSKIPLMYIKESFHILLDRDYAKDDGTISFSKLYENKTLRAILERFERILDSCQGEADMQLFFEENPILWNKFTPNRVIKKAPILNKYQTDFAIHSKSGELYLIEIEAPDKAILKRNGDRTADFNHAFDQINNWLHVLSDHRTTCLEMMGLDPKEVSGVHGVVIYGCDQHVNSDELRKLKSTDFGKHIFFYTYDDIANGFSALIRDIGEI